MGAEAERHVQRRTYYNPKLDLRFELIYYTQIHRIKSIGGLKLVATSSFNVGEHTRQTSVIYIRVTRVTVAERRHAETYLDRDV